MFRIKTRSCSKSYYECSFPFITAAKARRRRSAVTLLTSDDQFNQKVERETENGENRERRDVSQELTNLFNMDHKLMTDDHHSRDKRYAVAGRFNGLQADEVFVGFITKTIKLKLFQISITYHVLP